MKKILLLTVLIGSLLFSGCKKDTPDPDDVDQNSIENLQINDDFNFNTTINQELWIKLPSTVDYTNYRNKISIYTAPVEEAGILIANVSTDKNGVYSGVIPIPTYVKSLYILTRIGSATMDLTNVKATTAGVIDFSLEYSTEAPPIAEEKRIPINEQNIIFHNNQIKSVDATSNIIGNGDFSANDFGAIQYWNSQMTVDQRWHKLTGYGNNYVDLYNDNSNQVLRIKRPNAINGGVAQLIDAQPGDLITFSADFKSSGSSIKRGYLYLIPRDAAGNYIRFYSVSSTNNTNWITKTVTATMPPGTVTCEVLLWNHVYNYNAANYWDNVVVTGPIVDADGDGVNDDEDEYPNDGDRAFNIYYPNATDFATVAFEDNWPGKGDYDFNDLVIDYQYKQVINSDNSLVDLHGKYVVRAIGASYENGFGFQMNADPSTIASVTGTEISENYITLNANGTEANQSKTNIIVFDNAFNILPHPGGGFVGVNTQEEAPFVTADTMNITVLFNDPVSLTENGSAPFNPYIIIDQTRGREAHLTDNVPTDLMDVAFFGTDEDNSDPNDDRYYKTTKNLPWAINIPAPFAYPIEKIEVTEAHLHFAEWAESSGSTFTDWYLDLSGYRNESKIYNP